MHWGLNQYNDGELGQEIIDRAFHYTDALDKIRNQNWKHIFAEINTNIIRS